MFDEEDAETILTMCISKITKETDFIANKLPSKILLELIKLLIKPRFYIKCKR